jgi:beta-phosphoglucomutase-like phosphatase (HAD superfamily)
MADSSAQDKTPGRQNSALLWDMAGTLIPFDPYSGSPRALPGCDEFLPELAKEFRQVVTTGDQHDSARSLLSGFGLAHHFEQIYGDLFAPVGKPFGEVLRHLGARPEQSLAIGDRLTADIASDHQGVVSILINQGKDTVSVGMISLIIKHLRKLGPDFPSAFSAWCEASEPVPEAIGPRSGGELVDVRQAVAGFTCRLMTFRHPVLDGDRFIIQI